MFAADEWERLGLSDGASVEVFVSGKRKKMYFVSATIFVDPGWFWVTFETIGKTYDRRTE